MVAPTREMVHTASTATPTAHPTRCGAHGLGSRLGSGGTRVLSRCGVLRRLDRPKSLWKDRDVTEHRAHRGRYLLALALVFAVIAAACSSDGDGSGDSAPEAGSSTSSTAAATQTTASGTPGQTITEDRARCILPPGNYGGIPTNDDSLDQLPLYDGLTPLRGDVTDADIDQYFLPQNFEPVGETSVEETGREGLEILYDEYGIPHITGETREDVAFGAGWVTGRDRSILLDFGRGPARAAVADIPGIDAFSLVTRRDLLCTQRRGRADGDRPDPVDPRHLRRGGRGDHQRCPGLRRRGQRLLGSQRPREGTGDGQRRDRHHGLHRIDLRRRWRLGGGQRRVPLRPAEPSRRRAGSAGLGRPDADRRPRGADDDRRDLRLRHLHRRRRGRLRRHRRRVDHLPRSPRTGRGGGPRGGGQLRLRGRRRPARPAGVQLADRHPRRVGQRHHAGRDGSPARLLLPRDRHADAPERPGHRGPGGCRSRPGHVPPHRAHPGLRVEPDLGQPGRTRRVRRSAV